MPYPFLENYNFFDDPETMESGFKKPKPFLDQQTIPLPSRPLDQGMSAMPGDQPNFRGAMPPPRQAPTQLPPQRPPITTQGAPPKPFRPPMPKSVEGPFDAQNRVQGPISNAYQEKVLEPTEGRRDYKPSWQRRLGAVGMGMLTGPYGAQEFLNRPQNIEAAERSQRIDELKEGSVIESNRSDEQWNRDIEERRQDTAEKTAQSNAENRDSLIASRAARNNIAEYRAKNPGHEWKSIPGGYVTGFPRNGIGDPIVTRIASGTLDRETELDVLKDNAFELEQERGRQDRLTEGTRQGGRMELAGEQGNQARQTEGAKQTGRVQLAEIQSGLNIMRDTAKSKNPDIRLIQPRGGNYMYVDVNNPDSPPVDTGIATGTATPQEQAELNRVVTTTNITRDAYGSETSRTTSTQPSVAGRSVKLPAQRPQSGPVGGPPAPTTLNEAAPYPPTNAPTNLNQAARPGPISAGPAGPLGQPPGQPMIMTDKDGNQYDVSTWSPEDIEQGKTNLGLR